MSAGRRRAQDARDARRRRARGVVRPVRKRGSSEAGRLGGSEGKGVVGKPAMKTVRLEISDDVYAKLRNELGLKIAMGNFHGLQDEFVINPVLKGRGFREDDVEHAIQPVSCFDGGSQAASPPQAEPSDSHGFSEPSRH
jgi:hypothetical protein